MISCWDFLDSNGCYWTFHGFSDSLTRCSANVEVLEVLKNVLVVLMVLVIVKHDVMVIPPMVTTTLFQSFVVTE